MGTLLADGLYNGAGLNWQHTYVVSGSLCMLASVLIALFLVDHPARVNLEVQELTLGPDAEGLLETRNDASSVSHSQITAGERRSKLVRVHDPPPQAVSFLSAWKIPGVIEFAACFFFLKLTYYGMILWLPSYASKQLGFSSSDKTLVATLYDIGTIVGSILLGLLSDYFYGRRAPVCLGGLLVATVGHVGFILINDDERSFLMLLVFFLGFFVGGIANIVSGVAAADLGKQKVL